MGFNSVVFICNDAVGAIEEDPKGWWKKAWERLVKIRFGESEEFGHGHCANGFQAVWNQHADVTGVIIVGGNHASVVDSTYLSSHHTEEGQDAILIDILSRRGYSVRKKISKKSHPKG